MTSSVSRQIIYGTLALAGLFATWFFNLQFIEFYGDFELDVFIADNYVNPASASITNDILVAALTFVFWLYVESKRLGMRFWWIYGILTFGIAIAFAFPLFLLMRERRLTLLGDTAT